MCFYTIYLTCVITQFLTCVSHNLCVFIHNFVQNWFFAQCLFTYVFCTIYLTCGLRQCYLTCVLTQFI